MHVTLKGKLKSLYKFNDKVVYIKHHFFLKIIIACTVQTYYYYTV
jgi:hypothetical protein